MTGPSGPLMHPVVFDQPRRLTDVDSWHEHIPFAFFAVAASRPRVVVELGTWKGDSYCAFCQAVLTVGIPSRCYAIDTWEGDVHTGPYGAHVLEELRAHHDPLYGSFSQLLQRTFDEAVGEFVDASVDLLHVDGIHSYEAVRHDVETWLPKLSDRGVMLLHDTNVREPDFGVWRLWEELAARFPAFAFAHGHGLGVLAVGARVEPAFLDFLEAARRDASTALLFAALGSRIAAPARERRARAAIEAESERRLAEATRTAAERDALQHETNTLRQELDRLQFERDPLETRALAAEADLANVSRSLSWRVTAPLRAVKARARRARRLGRRLRRPRLRGYGLRPGAGVPLVGASAARRHDEPLRIRPLVSILTPVFDTDPAWLRRAVDSVRRQTYPNWQLVLSDDGSTSRATLDYLHSVADEERIEVNFGDTNAGIAAATNRALAAVEGEFVAFLDHDDELDDDALLDCVRMLNEKPDTDVVYTDEDKIDRRGRRSHPFFKPDWSPELFRGVMYVGHLLMVRRSLVESVGGLDSTFDRVQDYELMLRLSERTDRIEHVPRVLYHWRTLSQSVASSTGAKRGIPELQAAAVNRHLERCGSRLFARPNPAHPHRALLHPRPRARWPRVTVIVPTKDAPQHLDRCLASIFERSTYPNFELLLVDNGTTQPEARGLFDRYPVTVLPFDAPFNFSRVNNLGVHHANGELIVLLNNDTEVQTPEWLEVLVSLAEPDGVGAVGPLLVYPNGRVQHAGVVLGLRGTADHLMRGFPADADGYAGSLSCTREVSAVTGACMVMRRKLFVELGGFDESFATHYQDVDLCLRIRSGGRRILFTPRAVLRHHESATRGGRYDHLDRALLLDAWGEAIARGDPYYNPLLSLAGDDYRPRAAAA